MAKLRTTPTKRSVTAFLKGVTDERRKDDSLQLLEIITKITKLEPQMWGSSIVGFGRYHYVYDSGREGECFLVGFSPRKQNLTVYIMSGFSKYQELLGRLGKHTTGKSCLYIKSLDDVHLPTLKQLIRESVRQMRAKKT